MADLFPTTEPHRLNKCACFTVFQYLGKWYEIEKYFAVFEFGGRCVTANYSLGEDNTIKIFNKQISALLVFQLEPYSIYINASLSAEKLTNEEFYLN